MQLQNPDFLKLLVNNEIVRHHNPEFAVRNSLVQTNLLLHDPLY